MYGGQTTEAATENEGDANAYPFPDSTGFTAINRSQTQLLTPESSAVAVARPGQTSSRAIGNSRRRHNPDVARYLGLGSTTEPAHLEKYAPRPRRAGGRNGHRSPASLTQCNPQYPRATDDSNTNSPIMDDLPMSHAVHPEDFSYVTPKSIFGLETAPSISQDTVETHHAEDLHPVLLSLGDDTVLGAFPDDNGELLCRNNNDTATNGDDYDFDIPDDELLVLTLGSCFDISSNVSNSLAGFQDSNNDKEHSVDDDRVNAIQEAPPVSSSQPARKKFVSPVTSTTRVLSASREKEIAQTRKPIVRPLFPESVRDRSPIIGLSSNVVLRTCFRIGEAINQSLQAFKSGQQMIIELYARVLASERTETHQYFTFCDLFHIRPPYIKGAYDAAIWKAVPLFEYDSRRLLQQGRICRCVGVMKHSTKERIMTIHNIWEATWDDIQWVEGIVCS
ncbi:hypothetical protein yc1106_06832 [Curvularia clavata]|uniref:Uncharacterized protein n=1 Tax=Curvularia clavata TaxID=95742 RepID=A0A9Q8ZF25_CURCL|nr:hypothetical protein yc1106_06832 [Curvularia clavata]